MINVGVCCHLLQLSGLTVQSWQKKPCCLSDVITVHQQTLAMLGVNYGHPHPLHQRRQQQERPTKTQDFTLCLMFALMLLV